MSLHDNQEFETHFIHSVKSSQIITFADANPNGDQPYESVDSQLENLRAADSSETELCQKGILGEEAVSAGLSNMGRTANGTAVTFLHLMLPGYNLVDISILGDYVHLQRLEVPYNKLTDLSVVSSMPYLVELDASHNEIPKLLDFYPPHNLKEVDMSFNRIEEMGDLSAHHALTKLVLDKNYISEINGLDSCVALEHLSLAHNNITRTGNLDNLKLKYLSLRGNKIERMENLGTLRYLQYLDLSGNLITSLEGVGENRFLETIDLENNQISDIEEIEHIKALKLLRYLNLDRNPIQDSADYRMSLLYRIPHLSELDRHRAEPEEKVAAVNLFSPPPGVVAAYDHRQCTVYSTLRASKVYMSTLPSIETPYPILVLSGPLGAGKRVLVHRLVEEFETYFGLGVTHTTRASLPGELEGKDHHFVSAEEFDALLKKGDFLLTYQSSGCSYGVSVCAIEQVAEQGLACVLPMEVEGVLSLKLTHFQPRYILLLPLDPQRQTERLQAVGGLTSSQIEHAVSRTRQYQQTHQDRPGFFDRSIDTSDLDKAYSQLSRLIMTYLGIEGSVEEDQSLSASRSSSQFESGLLSESQAQQRQGSSSAASSVRTWSKPADPTPKLISPGIQLREGSSRRINSVERASFERRKSAAKSAAAGIIPKPIEQLINKPPATAPGEPQYDLGLEKPSRPKTVPSSLPQHDFYSVSPDSSVQSRDTDSHLSNISEAGQISPSGSPVSDVDDYDSESRPSSGISFASDRPALPPINTTVDQDGDPEY